jgi:hypothetical protein
MPTGRTVATGGWDDGAGVVAVGGSADAAVVAEAEGSSVFALSIFADGNDVGGGCPAGSTETTPDGPGDDPPRIATTVTPPPTTSTAAVSAANNEPLPLTSGSFVRPRAIEPAVEASLRGVSAERSLGAIPVADTTAIGADAAG